MAHAGNKKMDRGLIQILLFLPQKSPVGSCVGLIFSGLIFVKQCVRTHSEPHGPPCLLLLKGAHGVISHGNRWTREWGRGRKISKESRLSPVINGGIPAWRGGKRGRGWQVGKDPNSLRKTQRVWHEEKADNYLYWLKPASQHKKTENYGWINSQLEREGCRAKEG